MEEKQFKQFIGLLRDIDSKISILISLQKSSMKPPKLGKETNAVFKLCNGKNSVDDMVKILKKRKNAIEVSLNYLRKKGLIRTTKINKKTVYVKI